MLYLQKKKRLEVARDKLDAVFIRATPSQFPTQLLLGEAPQSASGLTGESPDHYALPAISPTILSDTFSADTTPRFLKFFSRFCLLSFNPP
jgi:hypothetical protein